MDDRIRVPAGQLDVLDATDAAFRLLAAGPQPLGLNASRPGGRAAGPLGLGR